MLAEYKIIACSISNILSAIYSPSSLFFWLASLPDPQSIPPNHFVISPFIAMVSCFYMMHLNVCCVVMQAYVQCP